MRAGFIRCLSGVCTCAALALVVAPAHGQTFRYEAEPRAGDFTLTYAASDSAPDPVPRMLPSQDGAQQRAPRRYRDPRFRRQMPPRDNGARRAISHNNDDHVLLTAGGETISPGVPVEPFVEDGPPGPPGSGYETYYDGDYQDPSLEPHLAGEPFLDGPPCGGCGNCDDCCGGQCYMKTWWQQTRCRAARGAYWENLDLYTGKQGFKGPVDQNVNGDFGFHVGANWGLPLVDRWGLGYQIGGNLIVSDFEGHSGPLGHRRSQFFATTGLFRRVAGDRGFQGGAVVDYLRDDFYIQMDLTQIRAELSYVYCHNEVGFWGAFGTNTSTHLGSFFPDQPLQQFSFEANNQYNLFYRYEFCNGTFCRTWIGMSGFGDGIFGSDATVRISERLGLLATYNYLLPRNHHDEPANQTESWNLTISMVWYPGYKRCNSWLNPYRPLFYVADNGWLFERLAN